MCVVGGGGGGGEGEGRWDHIRRPSVFRSRLHCKRSILQLFQALLLFSLCLLPARETQQTQGLPDYPSQVVNRIRLHREDSTQPLSPSQTYHLVFSPLTPALAENGTARPITPAEDGTKRSSRDPSRLRYSLTAQRNGEGSTAQALIVVEVNTAWNTASRRHAVV